MGLWLTVMYRNFFDECMIEDNISQSLQDTYKKIRKKLVTQMGLSYRISSPMVQYKPLKHIYEDQNSDCVFASRDTEDNTLLAPI